MFNKKEKIILGIVAFCVVTFISLAYFSIQNEALEVHFFDIGQGDAVFIETPNQTQILIDGGRDKKILEKLAGAIPFYDRHIDLMFATHMDADHIGGLLEVLEAFEVGGVVVSKIDESTEVGNKFWKSVKIKNIPVYTALSGDNFILDKDINIVVLSPDKNIISLASDNNVSLVMKLIYKDDSFLLTGDAEKQAEYKLAQDGVDLKSDVLKVGHHGSNTSSVKYFLDKVDAKLAIIQVGENSYGHPHRNVLERLSDVKILRNDINGDITLYSYGNSFD